MTRFFELLYWALTLRLAGRLRNERVALRLAKSGLFDRDCYLTCNPDVAESGIDPLTHYVEHGAAEGRNPNAAFLSAWYLAEYPDVSHGGRNPLDHWISEGLAEGRLPDPDFNLEAWRQIGPGDALPDLDQLAFFATPPEPEIEDPEPEAAEPKEEEIDYLPFDAFAEPDPPDPVEPPVVLVARRMEREIERVAMVREDDPVVVVVSHVMPYPPRAGNEIRIHRYIRWLEARGHQVICVACPLGGEERDDEALRLAADHISNLVYCERDGRVVTAVQPHLEHLVEGLDGLGVWPLSALEEQRCAHDIDFSFEASQAERTYCPDALIRVLLEIDGRLPEQAAFVASYVFNTRFLPLLRDGRLKLIDTIDVFSTKAEKLIRFGVREESPIDVGEERALLRRAVVVIAIQSEEALALRALAPESEVIEVGVDFSPAPAADARLPGAQRPPTVLFLGSGNAMNVQGLHDFLELVWPSVCRDHPDAVLRVAGPVSQHVPAEAPQTRVVGQVESVADEYRACHLVINPVAAGTGLKIKTLEALAHWRPLVTWPAGVDGVSPELRRYCDVAEDLYTFYLHVTKRLSERRETAMDDDERAMIEARLSPQRVYAELGEVLGRYFIRPG